MAARWGTGEEILNPCNMEYFSTANLDEQAEILQDGLCGLQHHGLDTGDTLEALQSCLDPSILSIFEQGPNGEVKIDLDDESEATLLTALTDILDNVDDSNLSPFDTLPDASLKISLSRSPPEKESLLSSRQFSGKTLPFTTNGFLQRCDSEEDDSFSMLKHDLSVSSIEESDFCLPMILEQDGQSMSITLGELVKHIHPCSMTVCVDGEQQLLPEGGIVLEVVDNGEHGEPILAIPDISAPLSLSSLDPIEEEQRVPEKSPQKVCKPELTPEEDAISSGIVKDDSIGNVINEHPKKESSKKCQSKKKKKEKMEETQPVERRVLRSTSHKKPVEEPKKEPEKELKKKKKKVTFAPAPTVNVSEVEKSSEVKTEAKPTKENPSAVLISDTPTTQVLPVVAFAEVMEPVPEEKQPPTAVPLEKSGEIDVPYKEEPAVSQLKEPKPKSLSLQQYRLLRQNKKPPPPEKTGDNSTKWPLLPEAPRELPPIPCLPDPNLRDPRRTATTPVKKELTPEIMPAWQPRGPAAPPTPEALLVPPASMLASSRKTEPPKPVCPSPTKPAENLPAATTHHPSPSVQPNPQNLPISSLPENTIPSKVSPAAKQTPLETPSLLVATTNGAAGQAKCLQDNALTSDQALKLTSSVLPVKVEGVSKPQTMTEITTITTTNVQTPNVVPIKPNAAVPLKSVADQRVGAPVPESGKLTLSVSVSKPTVGSQRPLAPIAAQPFTSAPIQARIVKLAEQMRLASTPVPKAKSTTAELIESFTSEIGIEASDLISLLEQFEETQPKEKQSVPEVCGRAAAVGNSSVEQHAETKALKKASSPDLGSTAGLTPPATPPHQMWKPLAPVALLGNPKKSEMLKPTLTKAIQIEPRPLPAGKIPSRPQTTVISGPAQPFSLDHDYCFVPKVASQNELGNRWNIKQQSGIVIKSVELPLSKQGFKEHESKCITTPAAVESLTRNLKPAQPPQCKSQSKTELLASTITVTPDASPNASPDRMDSECSLQDEEGSRHHRLKEYTKRSPSPYHNKRGRSRRTYRKRLHSSSGSRSSSSESSRSCSHSPAKKRCRPGRSGGSSRSPSRYRARSRSFSRSPSPCRRRYSYSSSCSGSWSQSRSRSRSRSRSYSRSRSRSPANRHSHWNTRLSPREVDHHYDSRENNEQMNWRKEKAIEERRVVYVGRIHGGMTRKELRERFSYFGEIEDCTVHFREKGDNYGFVTYYNTKDAFNAIENGSKIRQSNELPFDLCFGGRRQFCKTGYADLDSNQDFEPAPAKRKFDALDFDTLLKQAQRNLKR
ncbi:peroxisome proliferator-activated receptor gamma coactivator-related protein 1 isoform X2 [Astyanax mexicanus]|uniref:peroxisome proliferator-activated receptor gamma coactivator-related protein 1 isoform X2 n=1 Tax=Astyanax mexicanus TaxID=7994 RepID=UPI0020CB3134|nr:peroxisome proliferator-activated receptor gamma coactivator-related protein 1 isoform X2 [Astyanax mexicanus]